MSFPFIKVKIKLRGKNVNKYSLCNFKTGQLTKNLYPVTSKRLKNLIFLCIDIQFIAIKQFLLSKIYSYNTYYTNTIQFIELFNSNCFIFETN